MKTVFLYLLILILTPAALFAQDDGGDFKVKIKGFADSYHAVRTDEPNDWMSSRTRLRGEISVNKNHSELFFSANAVYNSLITDYSGFKIRELYISQTFGSWELRAGRQIITWGVADALRITDLVSPMDYSEFLAQDYDDIRIPENALRLKFTKNSFAAEALAVPLIETFELPTDKINPWAVSLSDNDSIVMGSKPDFKIENMEFGGRLSWFLSGVDFSLYALRTFNKMPVFSLNYLPEKQMILCYDNYHRMTMTGMDVSVPLGKFVFRGEFAEYFNEAQQPDVNQPIVSKNTANALLGVDIYPGGDWNISLQYAHKYICNYCKGLNSYCNSGTATVRISKDLFRSTLNVNTFAYIDVANGGVYDRTTFDYAVNDMLHVALGFDYFNADKGMFKMYDKNSEIFAKIKLSF